MTAKYKRDSIKLEVAFNNLDFDDPSTGMTFLSDFLIVLVFLDFVTGKKKSRVALLTRANELLATVG